MSSSECPGLWSSALKNEFASALEHLTADLRGPHASPFETFSLFEQWITTVIAHQQTSRPVKRALDELVANSQPSSLLQASAAYLRSPDGIIESIARMPLAQREQVVDEITQTFPKVDLRCYEELDRDEFFPDENSQNHYDINVDDAIFMDEFDEALFDQIKTQ
jgi:hypothetical protein